MQYSNCHFEVTVVSCKGCSLIWCQLRLWFITDMLVVCMHSRACVSVCARAQGIVERVINVRYYYYY